MNQYKVPYDLVESIANILWTNLKGTRTCITFYILFFLFVLYLFQYRIAHQVGSVGNPIPYQLLEKCLMFSFLKSYFSKVTFF